MYTNILEWLEERNFLTPNQAAFGDREGTRTYSQVVKASKSLAMGLGNISQTIGPVAIYMDKNVNAVCAMFGVVYAGGYYSNIDIQYPYERVSALLSNLRPSAVITDCFHFKEASEKFSKYAPVLLYEKSQENVIDEEWLRNVQRRHCDIDPLYCNFTSGSTGVPKGVLVSHRSVIDFIQIFVKEFGIGGNDIIANQAPLDFDVSVKDIYSGIAVGAKVQLVPREYFTKPIDLMDYLDDSHVTVLIWAVSALCFVSTMGGFRYKTPRGIRQVMFSGEVMPMRQLNIWKKYLPDITYINLYGPTEITCNCTYYILKEEDFQGDVLPIGKPFPNERVFLLDENQDIIESAGQTGEICVSGTCVSIGYLNQPDSAEFVQHPGNRCYYERIYKTGDLGYWRDDGNLVYTGRKDSQIKHLGHRIELGEIERCCETMPGDDVARSVCIYYEQKQRLLLFYEGAGDEEQLHRWLESRLPHFMIPSSIVHVPHMPINKNGKVDRKELLKIFLER